MTRPRASALPLLLLLPLLLAGCSGDTVGEWAKSENTAEMCKDGADNDGDGIVDCKDPDCWSQPACPKMDGAVPDLPPGTDGGLPDQAPPDQAQPDQAPPDQALPDQAPPDKAAPDNAAPDASPTGYALAFDGVDDYVTVSGGITGLPLSAVTVEAWVKLDLVPTGQAQIFYDGRDGEFTLHIDASGVLTWRVHLSSGWKTEGSYIQAKNLVGAWHHVAVTWAQMSGLMNLYVDGYTSIPTGVPKVPLVSTASGSDPTIGAYCTTTLNFSEFFKGKIDEVRLWKVERSKAEINANMNKPLTGSEAGLIGYWRLDEGSGTTAKDSSKSNKDGTLKSPAGPSWSTDVPF